MNLAPKGYLLKLETFPMPPTRHDRVSAIGSILESGGVHKLTLESGKDLRILRWTKDEMDGLPPEILVDTVLAATRNNDMDDCLAEDKPSPMELLFRGFAMVSKRGLRPIHLATKDTKRLLRWLKVDPLADTGEVFCTPILQHNSLPDGALLLIASQASDPTEVVYSVKMDMEDAK